MPYQFDGDLYNNCEDRAFLIGYLTHVSTKMLDTNTFYVKYNEKVESILKKYSTVQAENLLTVSFDEPHHDSDVVNYTFKLSEIMPDMIPYFLQGLLEHNLNDITFPSFTKAYLQEIADYLKISEYRIEESGDYYTLKYSKEDQLKIRNTLYHHNSFKYIKKLPDAQAPFKSRMSDSGYDLTLLKLVKKVNNVEFYDTGIAIEPPYGMYFDLVGRSSISKSGYILANNMGVIDQSYRGNIIVPLIKIDNSFPDLVLPNRLVQIIPRQIQHLYPIELMELSETERSDKGFGSSN